MGDKIYLMRRKNSLSQNLKIWLPLAIAAVTTMAVIWFEVFSPSNRGGSRVHAVQEGEQPNPQINTGNLAETSRPGADEEFGKSNDQREVGQLIKKLTDPLPGVREKAARSLGHLRDQRAVGPLAELLLQECREHPAEIKGYTTPDGERVVTGVSSGGSRVSSTATAALIRIGTPSVDSLIHLLDDGKICARSEAARALGEIGSDKAIEPLLELVRRTEWSVVVFLAQQALEKIGLGAVDPLIKALKDPSPTVRRVAAESLGKTGSKRSTEALTEMLGDPDKECRRAASMALKDLGDPAGAPALVAQLKSMDANARGHAALALGSMGSIAVPDLINTLRDERSSVRLDAIRGLGRTGDPRALGPLADYLEKKRPTTGECVQAVYSIQLIGGPEAMHTLSRLIENQICVSKAVSALGTFGPSAADILFRAMDSLDSRYHGLIIKSLGEIGDPRGARLAAGFLKDGNESRRITAAAALQKIADPRTTDELILALDDSNINVRIEVIKALGATRSPKAVEPLLNLFQQTRYPYPTDSDENRWFKAAVTALGDIGDPRAIDALKTILLAGDLTISTSDALSKLGQPGIEALCEVLLEEAEDTRTKKARIRAFKKLVEVGPPANSTIRTALQSATGRIKTDLLELLVEIDDSLSMDIYLEALEDEDPAVRQWAAVSLGRRGGPEVVQPLLTALRDPDRGVEGAGNWGLLQQGPSIVPLLIDLLKDDDEGVRYHAVVGLGEIGDSSALVPLVPRLVDRHKPTRRAAFRALKKIVFE